MSWIRWATQQPRFDISSEPWSIGLYPILHHPEPLILAQFTQFWSRKYCGLENWGAWLSQPHWINCIQICHHILSDITNNASSTNRCWKHADFPSVHLLSPRFWGLATRWNSSIAAVVLVVHRIKNPSQNAPLSIVFTTAVNCNVFPSQWTYWRTQFIFLKCVMSTSD